MDNRAGVSIGISQFILTLVVGAFVFWIVSLITDPILSRASNSTTNASANQATTWLSDGIGYIPVAVLLLSALGLVLLAIYRREILG
jgi:hypothetical protein